MTNPIPPDEYWEHVNLYELIRCGAAILHTIIRKQHLHATLQLLSEKLTDYEITRLKEQVSASSSFVALLMRNRIRWGLHSTDTGPVTTQPKEGHQK